MRQSVRGHHCVTALPLRCAGRRIGEQPGLVVVDIPAFSIAPNNCGPATLSSFSNGYGMRKQASNLSTKVAVTSAAYIASPAFPFGTKNRTGARLKVTGMRMPSDHSPLRCTSFGAAGRPLNNSLAAKFLELV